MAFPIAHPLAHLGSLALSVALFLAPGWLLGRLVTSPAGAVTAFLGSSAILFDLVLLLDAFRLPLTPFVVAGGFLAVTGIILLAALRVRAPLAVSWKRPNLPSGAAWIWIVPFVLAAASILARGVVEPLSGYDNWFRWDYLARLMMHRGSLDGYPPVRMEDFDRYSWCDGIPPLAPILNFLIYAGAGSQAAGLIAVRSVAELAMLGALSFRFARDLWGREAGWASLAILGSCTLLIWGISIEQENGLTAVSLVAMIYLLQVTEPAGRLALFWGGIAAGVGAASREYGLYFIILGCALLVGTRRTKQVWRFVVPAACVAAPWYVRNWIRTGDPVYPALGALFPTNAVHVEVMGDIAHYMGFRTSPFSLSAVPWVLLAIAGPAWILSLAGALRLGLRTRGILSGMLTVTALWIWSMPQTAGGWNYSMKVLVPVAALGAVLGGWVGAVGGKGVRAAVAVLLALVSVDAARRAWLLPDDTFASPWTLSFDRWRFFRAQDEALRRHTIWPVLAQAAAGRYIVVDDPQAFVATQDAGGNPTPLESPRAAALFDPSLSTDEAVQRLRSLGVRFLTLSVGNPVFNRLVQRHATLRQLASDYAPAANAKGLLIFDLEFLARRPQPGEPGGRATVAP